MSTFHYSDKTGWNAVRAQKVWCFKANQPKDPSRPVGAYFADIEPTEANLRTLYKRIRVPKLKQQYVFWFLDTVGLEQLNGGRGRDRHIFVSRADYNVDETRQKYAGETADVTEQFR